MGRQAIEYIIFPLNLLQGMLTAEKDNYKEMILKILRYGISNFSINFTDFKEVDLARQAIYLYYKKALPDELLTEVNDSGSFMIHDDRNGFDTDGQKFQPEEDNIVEMKNIINRNPKREHVWNWIKLSYYVQLEWIETYIDSYREILNQQKSFEEKHGKDCTASVKLNMMWDFFKDPPPADMLTAYIALRSIQGRKKDYVITYKKSILLRMTGCKSEEVYRRCVDDEIIERIDQIQRRRTFLRLLTTLENRGLVTGRFVPEKTNAYLISTSGLDAVEIARLYATKRINKEQEEKKKLARDLFNQITSKS